MDIDSGYVFALAGVVRDVIVAHYAAEGVSLPARRLRTPGLPAADCEMLAVWAERIFPIAGGNPAAEEVPNLPADPAYQMRAVAFSIYVLRCLPDGDNAGNPPTVAAEEAATALILADPILIWQALIDAQDAGDLPGCGAVAWEGWESLTPDGLLGGGVLTARMSLE